MAATAERTEPDAPSTIVNFGGNQTWQARCLRPRSEQEVLEILARRPGEIRAFGALHSWSDAAATSGLALDTSGLDQVEPFTRNGEAFVRLGAGCRLHDVLARLHAASDQTLPTIGAILRQTVAGAISTGTHGSGKASLSHFVAAVRVAVYGAGGAPEIFEYQGGDALEAARCALGAMGVIVSVDLRTTAKYLVEETVREHASLADVMARCQDWPLTQFILAPYRWTYVAFERRAVAMRKRTVGEWLKASLLHVNNAVSVDVMFHLFVKAAVAGGDGTAKALMRLVPRLLVKAAGRIDAAERVLTLGHYYFRHEEMELFVPQSRLEEAVEVLRVATEMFAGEITSCPEPIAAKLNLRRLHGELVRHTGSYVHHYPLFFRRVLPDETLISMTGGAAQPFYSISVFTYLAPERRQPYYAFCSWLARAMTALFDARPHWGKHFPLSVAEVSRLYPELEKFRALCRSVDPDGVFRNDYTRRVLGL
jgi:FAD/FMN-containing dehydrogenase